MDQLLLFMQFKSEMLAGTWNFLYSPPRRISFSDLDIVKREPGHSTEQHWRAFVGDDQAHSLKFPNITFPKTAHIFSSFRAYITKGNRPVETFWYVTLNQTIEHFNLQATFNLSVIKQRDN